MTWFCHYDWKRNYKPHAQGQQIRILPARDVLKVTHPSKLKALWLKGNVPGKRKFTAASNEGRLAAGCAHERCRPQPHQRALQASVRRTSQRQVSTCCEAHGTGHQEAKWCQLFLKVPLPLVFICVTLSCSPSWFKFMSLWSQPPKWWDHRQKLSWSIMTLLYNWEKWLCWILTSLFLYCF